MSLTLEQMLKQGEQALAEAGVEDAPRAEARRLAEAALHLTAAEVLAAGQLSIPEPLVAQYRALVQRRAAREPLSYVLGEAAFYGRTFLCDRRALAPRPETELLVETAGALCRELAPGSLVVDVGLGSGVIALTLALEHPHLHVWGTEISPAALSLARANARLHRLSDRVRLEEGSLLQPLREAGVAEQVAVVVSNPPYVRSGDLRQLPPEISRWEPRLALDGGPEGLDVYRALLAEAASLPCLQALCLEVGADTAAPVAALARRTWPQGQATVAPDLAGIPRIVTVHPQTTPTRQDRGQVAAGAR
jgi:release factor glutamine methyltransferase